MKDQNENKWIIPALMIGLLVFNIIYWLGKFKWIEWSFAVSAFQVIKAHWGLLMFLEFLAIASLFVDLILKYDRFKGNGKRQRLIFTALLVMGFVAQFGLGMMDIFMLGAVR